MIIPKDATPPARGEPDAFHTPKTLDTVGGLSRRDVGVALVVAGLGALTLAFT